MVKVNKFRLRDRRFLVSYCNWTKLFNIRLAVGRNPPLVGLPLFSHLSLSPPCGLARDLGERPAQAARDSEQSASGPSARQASGAGQGAWPAAGLGARPAAGLGARPPAAAACGRTERRAVPGCRPARAGPARGGASACAWAGAGRRAQATGGER